MAEPTEHATWRTSSHSDAGGNCVQFAQLPDGSVAFRDSKTPDTGTLHFPAPQARAWLTDLKRG
ncbi:DUF397 domain-containing protein [Streptomyces sp. DSM 44915]|uniref:DUF397 domain-containing protein n=1 Tax=Streptomyces chisholmiae TaxID=3075540 RepID=A0ABU2JT46_9ACTN|nr:DUF397 domain-containing protein [Streptomyces sp. DSM 44915]MDT0268166.1 DUF397 domain-containing protein [Streptomyces sp. DSM 44915]